MQRTPKKASSSTAPDVTKEKQSRLSERRLRALDRALTCNHPTADIEQMLADIERGREFQHYPPGPISGRSEG